MPNQILIKIKAIVTIMLNPKIQAVMNFMLKSTDGFCIGNVFLDFIGGISNVAQMVTQSIDQSMILFSNSQ